MRHAVLLLGLCLASTAHADLSNPYILPFGEREVLVANAGTAGSPSSGAVFYNPAGLALLEHSSISVSGSTYIQHYVDVKPFAKIDGTDLDYKASGFESIPATVSSIWHRDDFTLAFSVLVPEAIRFENRITFATTNTSTTLIQVQSTNSLWLALSGAKRLTDNLAIGITLFGMQESHSALFNIVSRATATPTQSNSSLTHFRSRIYNFAATLGVRWSPLSFLDAGVRVQSPAVRVAGAGDAYNYSQTPSGAAHDITETEHKDIPAQVQTPLDGTLGTCWHFSDRVRLLVDASVQTGISYNKFIHPTITDIQRAETRVRANIGLEVDVSELLVVAAGALYSPSTTPDPGTTPGVIRQNFYGVTGGVSWQSDRVRAGLGLLYLFSKGDYYPFGGTGVAGTISQGGIGATLVFSYFLGEMKASSMNAAI